MRDSIYDHRMGAQRTNRARCSGAHTQSIALLVCAAAACHGSDAATPLADAGLPDALAPVDATGDDDAATEACSDAWQRAAEVTLDATGRSDVVEISLPRPVTAVQLRLTAIGANSSKACYGIEEVWIDGVEYVGAGADGAQDVCIDCTQPVRLHPEAGYFVLPSGDPIPPFSLVRLRVALRECDTLLRPSASFPLPAPNQVRIEYAALHEPATDATLLLEVVPIVTARALLELTPSERAAWLDTVQKTVDEVFANARIELAWQPAVFGASSERLAWAPTERAALTAPLAVLPAQSRTVPIVFAPCLERATLTGVARPEGFAPHVPGSCSAASAAVYVASQRCGGGLSSPELAGVVTAHELGHYLGLLHVDESTPFPTDREPRAPNLMSATASGQTTLTDDQIAALRRHPLLREEP